MRLNITTIIAATVTAGALALSSCGSIESIEGGSHRNSDTIVVGSQDYYSNEIIAEIYSQALEAKGYTVDRQFRIGQREVYVDEIESGRIDVFPEYTGPLLQHWKPDTEAREKTEVYEQLKDSLPEHLVALDQSAATDQDSYVVTEEFAKKHHVKSIADLAEAAKKQPLTLGANSEAQDRPNGPKGLEKTYGVSVGFTPIEDSGGPLTVKALRDNSIQLAIIYSADPSISTNHLTTLEDPKGQFLASHVVTIAHDDVPLGAATVLNKVNATLTTEQLRELNARSVNEQLPSSMIAKDWIKQLL